MKWIVEAESIDDIVLGLYTISCDPLTECKDCKWADEYNHCAKVTWWNSEDDFCSKAERREE